jgi:hypothetical protein
MFRNNAGSLQGTTQVAAVNPGDLSVVQHSSQGFSLAAASCGKRAVLMTLKFLGKVPFSFSVASYVQCCCH